MPLSTNGILLTLVLFVLKHMVADYFLQTGWMMSGRARYWHAGRLLHAGIHAAGTAGVVALVGAGPALIVGLAVLDLVLHFNIDWVKAKATDHWRHTPRDAWYWRAMGLDQAAHHLTYVGLVWIWITWG